MTYLSHKERTFSSLFFSLIYEPKQGVDMLYTITETQVTNAISPHPEFITEYNVVSDDGTVFMRTTSEDKAVARQHQMTMVADMRDL